MKFNFLAIVCLVGCGQVYPLAAQPSTPTNSIQLPAAGATAPLNKPLHGFTLTVYSGWNEGTGYIPVRFELQRTGPSSVDTTVRLHLKSYNNYGYRGPFDSDDELGFHVWQDVEIPASAMQGEATLPYLQFDASAGISWEVLVDGSLAKELSGEIPYYYSYRNYGNSSSFVRFLIAESTVSLQTIVDLTLSMNPGISEDDMKSVLDRQKQGTWQGSVAAESGLVQVPIANFPTRAIDYNSIDIIYLTAEELHQLTQQKDAWQAVLDWVCSGGNLWIVGGQDNWERLSEVEAACGLPTEPANPEDRGWFTFDKTQLQAVGEDAFTTLEVDSDMRVDFLLAFRPNADPSPIFQSPSSVIPQLVPPRTLWHGLMLGQICVFANETPFAEIPVLQSPAMSRTNRFPLGALLSWRETWFERNGLALGQGNDNFWNWLVPGVGLAPVTMFQLLITLFVLVIGPVNFLLLKRFKRLYFLIVTVPLAAGLITASLFAYAFITDGLSTRVRVRSFTEIDQTTGQAASWARLSYYSGVSPSSGLRFPADVVLLPIESENRYAYYNSQSTTFLEAQWSQAGQHLQGDWLPSRAPTQYMAVRTRQSPLRLEVNAQPAAMRVENKLQGRIEQLVVCGEDGKFYWGEGIAAGESATLRAIDLDAARDQLVEVLHQNALEFPPGWVGSYSSYTGTLGPWRNNVQQVDIPSIASSSVLEVALERIIRADEAEPDSLYSPGRYVAIVERSPEVALGLDNAVEQASLHVIVGRFAESGKLKAASRASETGTD